MFASMIAAMVLAASPEATVQRMFEAFNAHDPAAMAALYASDARLTSSDFCAPRGQGDVERTYAALFRAFPDIHDRVDTVIVQGDRVAVRFTASSASSGFSVRIMTFLTIRDGRIVEDDSVFDTGGRPCTP